MLDWLKDVLGDSYTEEIDKKVSENIGKHFVARADFNAKNEEVKTLTGQITERDSQLEELKKVDAEGLQAKITELQTANQTAKTDYETQIAALKRDSALDTRLLGAKARDLKAVKALLDLDAVKLDGDKLLGLDDQLNALQQDKTYLFDTEEQTNTDARVNTGGSHEPEIGDSFMNSLRAGAGLEANNNG